LPLPFSKNSSSWAWIVPVYQDSLACESLIKQWDRLSHPPTLIIVLANNDPWAGPVHSNTKKLILLRSELGRGKQLNRGAQWAQEHGMEWIWFLHADSFNIEPAWKAVQIATQEAIEGGCLRFSLPDSQGFWPRSYEFWVHIRSIMGYPYGDQGYFVNLNSWKQQDGFQEWPLFEDLEWWRRLKKKHRFIYLNTTLGTSARRFEKRGWIKSAVRNLTLLCAFTMGISTFRLKKYYT